MQLLPKNQIISEMNRLGCTQSPFLFLVDFKGEEGYLIPADLLKKHNVQVSFPNLKWESNETHLELKTLNSLIPKPISQSDYLTIFNRVQSEILFGNSYLLNLTFATYVGENLNLNSIYFHAKSPYKLIFEDQFLFYSPESFVKIKDNTIYSYPMKGTIDAYLPEAEKQLTENKKELYEHFTIVDLIRNDLSMVSTQVEVNRFRFFEKIGTQTGAILQTISEISGKLSSDWKTQLGDIVFQLLPAGSISGAPKKKTMEIITKNETTERGFYTGVAGFFDGETLDSCVMIRFIKKDPDGKCYYHSGGGITALSDGIEEYQELKSKIYVPVS
jgi:para-aminobenzoate synthetase component 1